MESPCIQEELPGREVEVTVSVTLSKTVRVMVDDYTVDVDQDENGKHVVYDFSNCNLHKAVVDQVTLPQNLAGCVEKIFEYDADLRASGMPKYLKDAIKDCRDWSVDDYEIVLE